MSLRVFLAFLFQNQTLVSYSKQEIEAQICNMSQPRSLTATPLQRTPSSGPCSVPKQVPVGINAFELETLTGSEEKGGAENSLKNDASAK